MASSVLKYGAVLALAAGIFYQYYERTFFFVGMGIGRHVHPVSDFPYQCRRIYDKRVQACEDMWLSEHTRQLFLACSEPLARGQWNPNFNLLNVSGRSLNDAVITMDIDKPKGDSFEYRVLKHSSYQTGDGHLYLVGLTGQENVSASTDPVKPPAIDIALVNQRPPTDEAGNVIDASEVGGDFTIELFETDASAKELRHKKTYRHAEIKTPNNIAFANGGGFYITNDHGTAKAGWKFSLAPFIGNGDVTYCSPTTTECKVVSTGHQFPNGLLTSPSREQLFVPSAHSGNIAVFTIDQTNFNLTRIATIPIPYPIDNLSVDKNGDIWVPAFPKALQTMKSFEDPLGKESPTTIFRVRRKDGEWEVQKMLEDAEGKVLPRATTAVIHDAKTGRIFLSGVVSPFITVCEPLER